MKALALILLALPGFSENPRLSEVATYAAGKPAVVYCANDANAWNETLKLYGLENQPILGLQLSKNEVYLPRFICRSLNVTTSAPTEPFTLALLILTHEAQHVAGIRDEHAADCAALRKVAAVAITHYCYKPRTTRIRQLVRRAQSLYFDC